MEGQLFQLLDEEGNNDGLIWTSYNGADLVIDKDVKEYYDQDDPDPDGCVDFLNERYPNITFERVYVEEVNCYGR